MMIDEHFGSLCWAKVLKKFITAGESLMLFFFLFFSHRPTLAQKINNSAYLEVLYHLNSTTLNHPIHFLFQWTVMKKKKKKTDLAVNDN